MENFDATSNRRTILTILATLGVALVLSGCGSTANTLSFPVSVQKLVEGSAAACAKVGQGSATPSQREWCSLYYDLRLVRELERHVNAGLDSPVRFTPLPCHADGPDCEWRDDYADQYRAGFEQAGLGDPNPQPNRPLPPEIIPLDVQLEKALAFRKGLRRTLESLDAQIEELRSRQQ